MSAHSDDRTADSTWRPGKRRRARTGALTPVGLAVMNDHYFTASPASANDRRTLTVRLRGREVSMQTAPGVFCPDHLDAGTAVLLNYVPDPPTSGTFLDIGCGWGPISVSLAQASPSARVVGVDVNDRALDLARDNAAAAQCSNVTFARPEEVDATVRFELMWSNPPIRVGKKVLHELLLTWLPRLTVGGVAYLVVQKNLGSDSLQKWLTSELTEAYAVERATSVKGFRVLRVERLSDGGPQPLTPRTPPVTGAE